MIRTPTWLPFARRWPRPLPLPEPRRRRKDLCSRPYSHRTEVDTSNDQCLPTKRRKARFPFIDQIDQEWMKGRSDLLWTDGFHPNAAGHAMLGRRTAGELALSGASVIR